MNNAAPATATNVEARSRNTLRQVLAAPPSVFLFLALVITIAIHRPNQLEIGVLGILLRNIVPLGIVALGQLLVMRVRSIDLSGAGVVLLINYYFASGWFADVPLAVVCAIAITTGLAVGLINGLFVAIGRVSAVLVTLATNTILLGTVQWLASGTTPGAIPESMGLFYRTQIALIPMPIVTWVIMTVLMSIFLSRFVYGRYVSAVGENPVAARLAGIPVERTVIIAHVLCGLMAAIAAIVQTASVSVGSLRIGLELPLDAVAATILGGVIFGKGRGGAWGPFFGVLSYALLFVVLRNFEVPDPGRLLARGLIILSAVVVFGLRSRSRH